MTTELDSVLDAVLDHQAASEPTAGTVAGKTYIDAIPVGQISADHAYQRQLDASRVRRMAAEYDPSLVGVLEVSRRPDGTFRVIDGQHRLHMIRQARGSSAAVACNVHTGLSPEQEAQLFFDIDKKRRRLTGWDRWNARRGAGESIVLDIERIANSHGLSIDPAPKPRHLRCVAACEKLTAAATLATLDETLRLLVAAYDGDADSLRAEIVHGLGLVLATYEDEIDQDRLARALQGIASRQISARASALRETQPGGLPRLAAHVIVERYNGEPGARVEPFLKRAPSTSRAHLRKPA